MALLSGGGQAQYVTIPEELLMPIPEGLTLFQAAAIPEAWLTAFQLLHFVGEETLFIPYIMAQLLSESTSLSPSSLPGHPTPVSYSTPVILLKAC
jgi:hypothetical protein